MRARVETADTGRALAALRALARALLRVPRPWSFALVALWAGGIALLSSLPNLDARPGAASLELLGNLAHAFEFGILALLCLLCLPRTADWVRLTERSIGIIAALVVGYGFLDELHQARVPGRDASLLDLVTDAVGVYCVLKIVAYASRPDATSRGLVGRLLGGVLLCLLAAGFATLYTLLFGEGPWF